MKFSHFAEHFNMNRKNKNVEERKMKNFKNRIEKNRENKKKRILDFISY